MPADRESGERAETESRSAFDPAASVGLFVGVSSFEDERIPTVPFAVDDAVDLAHLFTLELGLVLPAHTVLLLAGEPRKRDSIKRLEELGEHGARRRDARQRNIYRYVDELAQASGARGLGIFTLATHGVSDQDGDFLVAADSLSARTLRTGVSVSEVFDEIAKARAQRCLVLLDACRERLHPGTRGMEQSFARAIEDATGLVVLSGATLGGFAYDDTSRRNGVFTAAVLDGLRGAAPAGPEGWITVRTLADFIQQRVAAWVRCNRPEHAAKSLGIARRIEATAETLPLAPHPEATRARRHYRERRKVALARVKENLGRVLTGASWDELAARLPEEIPTPEAEQLLDEIEALDGSERSQRSLRDYLRELSGEASPTTAKRSEKEKKRRAMRKTEFEGVDKSATDRGKMLRSGTGVVAGGLLIGIIASYLLGLVGSQKTSNDTRQPSQRIQSTKRPPARTELGGAENLSTNKPEEAPLMTSSKAVPREAQGQRTRSPAPPRPQKDSPQPTVLLDGTVLQVTVVLAPRGWLIDLPALVNKIGGTLAGGEAGEGFTLVIKGKEVKEKKVDGAIGAISVGGGDPVLLSQPTLRAQGTLLVPFDFLQRTYGDIAGFALEWRPVTQQLFISSPAREIPVLFDLVNVQETTTIVLQFPQTPRYQVFRQPGQITVQMMGDHLIPPANPPKFEDPLVKNVAITPEQVRIQINPKTQVDNWVIEEPFRIVFDVQSIQ